MRVRILCENTSQIFQLLYFPWCWHIQFVVRKVGFFSCRQPSMWSSYNWLLILSSRFSLSRSYCSFPFLSAINILLSVYLTVLILRLPIINPGKLSLAYPRCSSWINTVWNPCLTPLSILMYLLHFLSVYRLFSLSICSGIFYHPFQIDRDSLAVQIDYCVLLYQILLSNL